MQTIEINALTTVTGGVSACGTVAQAKRTLSNMSSHDQRDARRAYPGDPINQCHYERGDGRDSDAGG
jgi:hypothetical protein